MSKRPRLRVILDEGTPVLVGHTFVSHGHEVIWFHDVLAGSSADELVWITARDNGAILIADDRDTGRLKKRNLHTERYNRLSLIKLRCPGPMAHKRIDYAMSLIEHEWGIVSVKASGRLIMEISTQFIKIYR